MSATGAGQPAVEVSGLEVDYGDGAVLAGVDLEVHHGEVLGLLGPSGCGKTTLLRSVAGFLRPARGVIRLGGRQVAGGGTWVAPEDRNVGLVPQEGALFPHLDVGANVAFGLGTRNRTERATRVAECLELVGLPGFEKRRPRDLSGGQQQRIALARALAARPSVVLLDEPFSALDAALRAQVREEVRDVLRSAGATAVLVTHDQEEALSFASRVAVLRGGRIAQVADPATLYRHPVDLEVGRFVGESVSLPGRVLGIGTPGGSNGAPGAEIDTELGRLHTAHHSGAAFTTGAEVTVLLRPEQIEMVAVAGAGTVAAVVESVTYFGHDALVRLHTEANGTELLCRTTREELPAPAEQVAVLVTGAVTVFAG